LNWGGIGELWKAFSSFMAKKENKSLLVSGEESNTLGAYKHENHCNFFNYTYEILLIMHF